MTVYRLTTFLFGVNQQVEKRAAPANINSHLLEPNASARALIEGGEIFGH